MPWRTSLAVLAVLVAPGCASWQPAPVIQEVIVVEERDAPAVELLGLLDGFLAADAEGRATLYLGEVARLAAQPEPDNRLRLALLQAVPGHANSRPVDAARLLEHALADEAVDEGTRGLVLLIQRWLSDQGAVARERRRLQARVDDLETELDEARAKIEALAELERMLEPALCGGENGDDCPPPPDPVR